MSLICPKCGAESPDDARFCEVDGERLSSETAPSMSDAGPVGVLPEPIAGGCFYCHAGPNANVEGYCSACGRRWRTSPAPGRDHKEISLSPNFGGVTDRGRRHPINEDDFAIALVAPSTPESSPVAILVVCDGVSSSEDAHRASAAAVQTICAELQATATEDAGPALVAAISSADRAVRALAPAVAGATSDPPETTVVAAVVRDNVVTVAWVGDSRAYWIKGDDKPTTPASRQLTRDHSWMNDVVEAGDMTEAEAAHNRLAHAITRCLGGGASDDPEGSEPSLATFTVPEGASGRLLLCTDGLWNYTDSIDRIGALVKAAETESAAGDAMSVARSLVAWANAQGGRDNITAAMLRLGE